MHVAKGLEFRAVAVMACDDEIIPSQERIENVADDADLEEIYDSERHLLYVACIGARDHLLVSGVRPASEFLDDLANRGQREGRRIRAKIETYLDKNELGVSTASGGHFLACATSFEPSRFPCRSVRAASRLDYKLLI